MMGSVFLLLSLIGVLACSSFCMSILAHEYRQLFDDQEMQHLEGSRIGETVTGLHKLKHYLARFGYLDRGAHVAAAGIGEEEDRFDDGLESALKLFQRTHKLNVSGVVDSATLDLVKTPRCGVPDFVNGSVPHNISTRWVHYKGKIKWPRGKRTLTWSWLHPTLPYPFARLSIEYALAKWAEVTGFTFKEIPFEKHRGADIKIGFFKGDHGDGFPFDGPGETLAHATHPIRSFVHFDDEEAWTVEPSEGTMDLPSVALHELGHTLGLNHSEVPEAVMYGFIPYGSEKRLLTQDDIDGIKALYS